MTQDPTDRRAETTIFGEAISNEKKLTLISQLEPGFYVFARREGEQDFDELAARVITLAVEIMAFDLQVDARAFRISVEIRPRPYAISRAWRRSMRSGTAR